MATILKTERGQVIQASDAHGIYYYLADDFGTPTHGAFSKEEDALAAFEAEDSGLIEPDLEMDDEGYRLVECVYCGCRCRPGDSVPEAGDEDGWEEAAKGHAGDCEWVATRAHRREAR